MSISLIGYSVAAFSYVVFFLVLLTDKHKGRSKSILLFSVFSSFLWAVMVSMGGVYGEVNSLATLSETLKNISWLFLLLGALGSAYLKKNHRSKSPVISAVKIFLLAVFLYSIFVFYNTSVSTLGAKDYQYIIQLMLALCGIVLIEQLYRNVKLERRWAIKYLCLGLLGSYAFSFYMYSDAILSGHLDSSLWQSRGYVEALLVPLLALSISKDPLWSPEIFISRRVVFHTSALLASSLYLIVMGAAGIYAKQYGGEWADVLQVILIFVTLLGLLLLLVSRRLRARMKVLVNKHFYPYKYDYREEWLRFINTISFSDEDLNLKTIRAISQIINSPSGQLWLKKNPGYFECVETLNMPPVSNFESANGTLAKFMSDYEFVISVDEFRQKPEVYHRLGELELPQWVDDVDPWLIVPLIHINSLIGFIILSHSAENVKYFNWEDSDLLKTAARQVASYIAQQQDSAALAEAKQFESFNKLTTYIVHDIKNLVAQLSLIVTNAEKHKHNPLFMEDVVTTVGNTVTKMNTMLDLVNSKTKSKKPSSFDIVRLLNELVKLRQQSQSLPVPVLKCESLSCTVEADKDQLLSVFGHLIQNAQDATADDGEVTILQSEHNGQVVVNIVDTGTGMDENFIKYNLFKPFRSTKGKGMGIGVYEAREILQALGGSIEVRSRPGHGSCFTVQIPIAWLAH